MNNANSKAKKLRDVLTGRNSLLAQGSDSGDDELGALGKRSADALSSLSLGNLQVLLSFASLIEHHSKVVLTDVHQLQSQDKQLQFRAHTQPKTIAVAHRENFHTNRILELVHNLCSTCKERATSVKKRERGTTTTRACPHE